MGVKQLGTRVTDEVAMMLQEVLEWERAQTGARNLSQNDFFEKLIRERYREMKQVRSTFVTR